MKSIRLPQCSLERPKGSMLQVFFLHSCRSLSIFVMIVFAALQYLSYLYCVQQLKSREKSLSGSFFNWAKIRKKSAQCLFAGLFLFEVFYCPMLFSKNLINVRKTLSFRYFTFRKNRNIEPKKAFVAKKMVQKEKSGHFGLFFSFLDPHVLLL